MEHNAFLMDFMVVSVVNVIYTCKVSVGVYRRNTFRLEEELLCLTKMMLYISKCHINYMTLNYNLKTFV